MSHTQDIHATFKLQGLFDDELRLLGDVCHKPFHGCSIDVLFDNHLHFLRYRLDLKISRENNLVLSRFDS